MKMRKFKIGIIGTGWIAESHIGAYLKCPDVEIVAAADLIPGKAEKFMERYGVKGVHFYKDHKEMIDNEPDLDGVSMCTYNTQHAGPTIYCLEHNIPVLLEKPFTVTLEEAEAVKKAEEKSEAFILHGFQPRYEYNMQKIKKIVESGTLGKVYYIQTGGGRRRGIPGSTFIEKSTGGIGALGDIGCYSLDMVLNAVGYPKPLTVSGYTSDYFGKNPKYNGDDAARFSVDDFGAAFIRLEGDIILDFRIAWAMHPDTPGDTIIFGTEGALRIPSTDCWNGEPSGPMTLYHDIAGVQMETVIPLEDVKPGVWFRLWDRKIRTFLNTIEKGGPSPVPTSQIIYNQAIIDGIAKSAACGHEIEIKFAE
ncbi:MAG: Gfo/Idh/MocA family oxidoreductase [Ruminococcaceae bacterium]|nr:Gfo/Idh/MocA family oxidoreductase [Oscillospiraceae bacterium]